MSEKVIPPMTHPLGTYWRQPKVSEIRIEGDKAFMSQQNFEMLHEYSTSYPSGSYLGKMWKRKRDNESYYLVWIAPHGEKLKYEYAVIVIMENTTNQE